MRSVSVELMRPEHEAFITRLSLSAFGDFVLHADVNVGHMIRNRDAVVLVALVEERPVGFAVVNFSEPAPALNAIAVEIQSRGFGVGRRLLAGAERVVLRKGGRLLTLVTATSNVAALDLFLKSGYAVHKQLQDRYRAKENAVAMSKRLG